MEEIKRNMKEIKEKVDEIYIDLCQRVNKIDGCINDLEDKIVNLELENSKETEDTVNDEWIPNECEIYYFVDLDYMEVDCCRWNNGEIDNIRLNHKMIFETRKEADEYLEYLEEKEKYINTFTEEEWKNNPNNKYYYYYNYKDNKIDWDWVNNLRENVAYFRKSEEVEDFIKKYKWQIKHELGVK